MKRRYEMTADQHARLLEACRPVPYILGSGGVEPCSPQQNVNAMWQALAAEMGFVWDSAEAAPGESSRVFMAEPQAAEAAKGDK